MNDVVPQYPWSEGDHLFASALNAAIANGPYMPTSSVNVLHFGADATGAADSTTAFLSAIATGQNVYIPRGSYIIRNQLTTQATGQVIFGDGRSSILRIDQTFSASATCVIALNGREHLSPIIRDLTINFAQPSDQTLRSNFRTLAAGGTSGTGGTGVMYPPAIGITTANRFKLSNLRISLAWDGIRNMGTNTTGGFFIRDIEMSAFNVGLSIDNVFDFSHITAYHMWDFDVSTSLQQVWWDGNTFAAKFGVNNDYAVCACYDFCCYDSRVQIAGANSAMDFYGLHMDGNNATLEISNGNQIQISGVYFSGSPTGANPSTAQCNISGGKVIITNIYAQAGSGFPAISQTGGFLFLIGGELQGSSNNETLIQQSAGRSYITGITFANPASAAWTVPVINVSAGLIMFHSNMIQQPSIGDVGALVIATDNAQHSVGGNAWNGWKWTPPGTLGNYGFNDDLVTGEVVVMGGAQIRGNTTVGSATSGSASLFLQAAAATQRALTVYSANSLRWAMIFDNSAEAGGNAGCNFAISRYNDVGGILGTPFSIVRATGAVSLGALPTSTSYANDAAAAAGGVAVGGLYRNGSVVQVRVV